MALDGFTVSSHDSEIMGDKQKGDKKIVGRIRYFWCIFLLVPATTVCRRAQANDGAVAVTAGSNHVFMVHRSGQLYTWGVGASGRLGLDLLQGGNPQVHQKRATVFISIVYHGRSTMFAFSSFLLKSRRGRISWFYTR